jgi:hypothetical protein
MRRVLVIGTCALLVGAPARADGPVIDFASLAQLLREVQQAAQQIQLLQQQVQQLMTIYSAIAHVTNCRTTHNGENFAAEHELRHLIRDSFQRRVS